MPDPHALPDARIDERDTLFARMERRPGTAPYEDTYARRPAWQAIDDRLRAMPPLLDPRGRHHDPVLADATAHCFEQIERWREDPALVDAWAARLATAPDATAGVKTMLLDLGAVAAGCTDLPEAFVYTHKGRFDEDYGRPVVLDHGHALVFLVEMDHDRMQEAPRAPTLLESARQYERAAAIARTAAAVLRRVGHDAKAHYDAHYDVLLPPLAVRAGLGELGRNNILVADRYGSRVRIGVVTTDLPVRHDAPISLGVERFCRSCAKCAELCPSHALSRGDPELVNGVERWPTHVERCHAWWRQVGTDCGLCMAACPFSHRAGGIHGVVRWLVRHAPWTDRTLRWLDDRIYGRARWRQAPAEPPTPPPRGEADREVCSRRPVPGRAMNQSLYQSLNDVHRYDDLEDLLDFVCERITACTTWETALVTYYFGDDVAYGAAGCPADVKDRFRDSFDRTPLADRIAKRRRLLEFVRTGTNICFIPAGEGPRPATAFIPSEAGRGDWDPDDRLLIVMRDPRDEILGLLSLDNPRSGNRPDEKEFDRLDEIDGYVNVVGKVAENRFWARRLRESDKAYRQVFDAVTDGLFINDLEGRIVQVNPAGCRMHGYEREELLGESSAKLIPEEHADRFRGLIDEVARGGRVQLEATGRRRDGTTFDSEVYSTGFQYRGRPHLLVVLRDITERKQVFRRLLEDQKDESIVAVAGGVAHDFNNLLMGMTGPLSLLRRDLTAGSDAARHADRVAATAEHLARLTGQLLAIARGVHSEPRPTSLRGIVEDNLPLLHGLVGTRFRIDLHIADSPALVHADRAQLDQVLLNLAQNACEAMDRAGTLRITVDTVTRAEPFGSERTGEHPAGEYVRLLVQDTGQGMDEDTRKRVFEPYFSTKSDGSGLGLAAVLGIVRRHQGAIVLESTPGEGTRIEVLFPPCSAEVEETPAPKVEPPASPSPHRVLLVDDHDMVREVAAELLVMLECEVDQAASGEEALELYRARKAPYDLVLLDVSMPGMTGVETHEALVEIDPAVRVVLSSGHAERLVRQEVERGMRIAGFLQKPYTLDRLQEALEAAMRV